MRRLVASAKRLRTFCRWGSTLFTRVVVLVALLLVTPLRTGASREVVGTRERGTFEFFFVIETPAAATDGLVGEVPRDLRVGFVEGAWEVRARVGAGD